MAHVAGISHSWLSRIELGRVDDLGLRLASTLAAVVGLDLSIRTYPGGQPLRDEGHRRLLARIRLLLPPDAPWQTEVPLPRSGDQRAWDAATRLWQLRVGIEAEMRLSDLQALQRRLGLKLRDGGTDRLLLAVADTRHNRSVLRLASLDLTGLFPLQGRAAIAAIRAPLDPGCNLLVLA